MPEQRFKLETWHRWRAPVVPPTQIQDKVRWEGRADWNSSQKSGGTEYVMHYRTRQLPSGEVVTHLLPGSEKPVDGWLIPIA